MSKHTRIGRIFVDMIAAALYTVRETTHWLNGSRPNVKFNAMQLSSATILICFVGHGPAWRSQSANLDRQFESQWMAGAIVCIWPADLQLEISRCDGSWHPTEKAGGKRWEVVGTNYAMVRSAAVWRLHISPPSELTTVARRESACPTKCAPTWHDTKKKIG